MSHHEGPFEVDRGVTGRIRINVISVANLLALIALIGTAFATWNGLTSKVDVLSVRVENATSIASQLRSDLSSNLLSRDAISRDLSGKVEAINSRLTAVEVVLTRMERKIERN